MSLKIQHEPEGLKIRHREDYAGDPYSAKRSTLYCGGCGCWLPIAGDLHEDPSPLQVGFGICRDCWLRDSDKAFERAHRGAWNYILQTFAGPWPATTPK